MEEGADVIMVCEILTQLRILLGELIHVLSQRHTSRIDNCKITSKDLKQLYFTILVHGCISVCLLKFNTDLDGRQKAPIQIVQS
jgi:hypothetical protein